MLQWNPRMEREPNSDANATVTGPELTKKMFRKEAAMRSPTKRHSRGNGCYLSGGRERGSGESRPGYGGFRSAARAASMPKQGDKNQQDG
jgi:hypothetical protein